MMEFDPAVAALSALAHPGRLAIFRLLVKAGPEGMAAGDIARAGESLPNTLSNNLNILSGAQMDGLPPQQSSIRKASRSRIRS